MLELKNISYEVDGNNQVFDIIDDISFKVDNNKFIVITGPNGGGKSTIAKIIAGVIEPTGGEIFFEGNNVTELGITDRANLGIGYGLQQPVRFKGIDVKTLIQIAAGEKISTADACEYLEKVGLRAKEYVKREVDSSLSGGELKRIEIATILARKPKLAVFDEPEAGIDLWSFQNLIQVFEQMREEIKDSSIIVISHQERILEIADEIIVIEDGHIREHGPKDEILPHLIGTESAISD
jgi:Fe-S cluster assembly ATP-binding protein